MNGAARTRLLAAHVRPFVNDFLEGRYQGLIAACVRVHMITCKSMFAVGGHRSESCSWRASLVSFLCDIFCTKTSGRTLILLNKPFYFRGY